MDLSMRALTLAAMLLPALAHAGTVEGLVFEKGTGAPLAGVEVLVGEQTVRTDEDGSFSVEMPAGVVDVRVGDGVFAQVVVGHTEITEVLVTLSLIHI